MTLNVPVLRTGLHTKRYEQKESGQFGYNHVMEAVLA